ncbi:hypothetical protein B0A49_05425 [Cryomyces minteri]|uniref:Uncharacterized protein n=1 Tax=Cryomyces minteri TaxID=331657 RepID=A0A4U0XF80_9PEZI|nr:hypothetical protein B0A49_05425 [Cryomyces minteri]
MGSNSATEADGIGPLTIQRALDMARNTEGDLDPTVSAYLEEILGDIWDRIQAQPDTYILSKEEFAVFNYYRQRFDGSDIAQRAVARFWANYQGDPAELNDT